MNISDKQQFALICILLAGIWCASFAFECTPERGYDGCACYRMRNNTKEYVNLLPLKTKSSSPRFTVLDKDRFYISYSPCGVFSEFVGENQTGYIPCIKASVARWTNLSTHRCESLGDDDHAKFESTVIDGNIKSNLTLTFRSEVSGHHTAKISLVCNDNLPENETFLEYINTTNVPTDTYFLALTSKCCCPGKCGSPPELPPTPSPTVSNATTGRTGKPPVSSSGPLGALEMGVVALVAGSVLSASFGV